MIRHNFESIASAVLALCKKNGLMLATAESCTGGLVAAALTDLPGSSEIVERGFVTYSNEAKSEMLGVSPPLIAHHGAVSAEVAEAMAQGVIGHAPVDLAIAVTGIAGPTGASADKPVGLVYFAVVRRGQRPRTERHIYPGDRAAVRSAATRRALELLLDAAHNK